MKLSDISGQADHILLELQNGTAGEGRLLVRAIALTVKAICAAAENGKPQAVNLPPLTQVSGGTAPAGAVQFSPGFTTVSPPTPIPLEDAVAMVDAPAPPQYRPGAPSAPPKRKPDRPPQKSLAWTSKFPPTFKQQGLLKYLAGQSSLSLAELDALAIEEARNSGGADAKFVTGFYAMSGKIASRVIDRLKNLDEGADDPELNRQLGREQAQAWADEPDPQF